MMLTSPRFGSLTAALDHHASTTPDALALMRVNDLRYDEKNRLISYSQLHNSARHLAAILYDTLTPGSRILLPTSVSEYFSVGFLACLYAGMVAVPSPLPTQYKHQRDRLNNIVRDAGIAALLCSPEDEEAILVWLQHAAICCPLHVITFRDDVQYRALPVATNEALALLQYTSGSTGNPKGVMLTHGNLMHNAHSFQMTLAYPDDTRFGGWIPHYHDMGLMAQLLPALVLGSSCYLMTPTQFLKRPIRWLQMIERFKINHSCAPNFAFELCRRRISADEVKTLDLSSLHYLINGSEPVHADTIAEFTDYFRSARFAADAMQPCYGMAECTVFISGSPPRRPRTVVRHDDADKAERLSVSCGYAPYYQVKIVDPNSLRLVNSGECGEIWLQGSSVAKGYWNNPQATKETFMAYTACGQGPYLRTGDIGFLQQGEIFVSARIKELIITHGRNLYPQDIEHSLRRQFPMLAGRYGAVFSVNLKALQEVLVVCHELPGSYSEGELAQLSAEIQRWVLCEWGAPLAAVILLPPGEVSRTTSGKIQRTTMKQRFFEGTLRVRHQWLSSEVIDALSMCQETVDFGDA